jgi:hypothetical protein
MGIHLYIIAKDEYIVPALIGDHLGAMAQGIIGRQESISYDPEWYKEYKPYC